MCRGTVETINEAVDVGSRAAAKRGRDVTGRNNRPRRDALSRFDFQKSVAKERLGHGGGGGNIHGSASMNPAFNYVLNRPCPRVCRAFMPGPRRWTRRRIRDITSRTPIIMRIRKRKKVARPPMRRGLCAPIYAAKMYTSHPPRPIWRATRSVFMQRLSLSNLRTPYIITCIGSVDLHCSWNDERDSFQRSIRRD